MAEIYDSLSSSPALPSDIESLGTRIQDSRGDPEYILYVSVAFRHYCGDSWEDYKEYYAPTQKHSKRFLCQQAKKLDWFWSKIDDYRHEFERVARKFYQNNGD